MGKIKGGFLKKGPDFAEQSLLCTPKRTVHLDTRALHKGVWIAEGTRYRLDVSLFMNMNR